MKMKKEIDSRREKKNILCFSVPKMPSLRHRAGKSRWVTGISVTDTVCR